MDRIIFGDNQFFGINHMSEDKAQSQSEHFKDISTIIHVIDTAYDAGIHAFMFNTHDRVAEICDHFRANPDRYPELRLYPSLPYAHKYANAVNEKGIVGALKDVIFPGSSAGEIFGAIARGSKSIIKQDMFETMKLLIDIELRMFRDLNVKAVFLQNIITDLMLGLGVKEVFIEFSDYIKNKYKVEPAFNSMNMPRLVDFLLDCGIDNPIVCSSVNKIGYLMNPDIEAYETTIREQPFRPMAMSILASGAVPPREAIEYVVNQENIRSIVFGASSRAHIVQTKNMIEEAWAQQSGNVSS
jgi:hypothetical protein